MGLLPWRRKKKVKPEVQANRTVTPTAPSTVQENDAQSRPRSTTSVSQASTAATGSLISSRASRRWSIGNALNLNRRRSSRLDLDVVEAEQSACMLLTKLPYEVRESIFLSIVQDEGSWEIPVREVADNKVDQRYIDKVRASRPPGARNVELADFIKLMLTCRAMNREMAALLHRKAHLHLPSLSTLVHFFTYRKLEPRILSLRQTIRNLTLRVELPYLLFNEDTGGPRPDPNDDSKFIHYNTAGWTAGVTALTRLEGMRFLRIELIARDYSDLHPTWPNQPSEQLQKSLFHPLKALQGLEHFRIAVSWTVSWDYKTQNYPFELLKLGSEDVEPSLAANGGTPEARRYTGAAARRLADTPAPASLVPGVFQPFIPSYYG